MTVDQILECLEGKRIRATYGAVGAVIGRSARSVGVALGSRRRRASWVVRARDGEPTGYDHHQKHPDIYRTRHIIKTGDELRHLCAESHRQRQEKYVLPNLVVHADWSTSPGKRWCAIASLESDGRYGVDAPEPVGEVSTYFTRLLGRAGPDAVVLSGFDFPIGLPKSYAHNARLTRFPAALSRFGRGRWIDFYRPADTPSAISVTRPFYPTSPRLGTSPQHLVEGLHMRGVDELYRRCDVHPDRARAAALFWLVGGKQVGKAAITGWRDLLAPALAKKGMPVSIWPFDGCLAELLARPGVIVAETYPAESYRHLHLAIRGSKRSKRRQSDRAEDASPINDWVRTNRVHLTDRLHGEIADGFGDGTDGEDRFDAVVGLCGMLDVVLGNSPSGEPDDATTRIEGWILGQPMAPSTGSLGMDI